MKRLLWRKNCAKYGKELIKSREEKRSRPLVFYWIGEKKMVSLNSVVNENNNALNASANGKVTRQIFVTGGVASSLGKGLSASSLGQILRSRGLSVTMQKFDPYLNVDPGTMNPFQHGEVFVTDDGAETDLDIGHYERFLDENLDQSANVTTGQVYSTVIAKERRGEYLGDTVQVIPHITDEIKARMRYAAEIENAPDIIITEIGGTVGDIESLPFMEAARQVRRDVGRQNVFFLHVSLVPFIGPSGELKTKPTQHSVAALRGLGILPDGLILRCERDVPESHRAKIGNACDVDTAAVISCPDAPSIYDIPKTLHSQKLDDYILEYFGMTAPEPDFTQWDRLLDAVHRPSADVNIALVGKYIDLPDAYLSVSEALRAGGFANNAKVNIKWVAADLCATDEDADHQLHDMDAILVPGGFGIRGLDGKIGALKYAREHKIPTLGICLGLQSMVIEYARNVLNLSDASSTEFDPETSMRLKNKSSLWKAQVIWAEPCVWVCTQLIWFPVHRLLRPMARPKWRNGIVTGTKLITSTVNSLRRLAWLSPVLRRIPRLWSMLSSPLMCILTMWRLRLIRSTVRVLRGRIRFLRGW